MAKLEVRDVAKIRSSWVELQDCDQGDVVIDENGDRYLVTDEEGNEKIYVVALNESPRSVLGMIYHLDYGKKVRHVRRATIDIEE
jgi:hypothetical protein